MDSPAAVADDLPSSNTDNVFESHINNLQQQLETVSPGETETGGGVWQHTGLVEDLKNK